MFTGLISALGHLREIRGDGTDATFVVECPWRDLVLGESIAVNGVCLSVTREVRGGFECDATAETLAKTTLGALVRGAQVHLERAMRAEDRLGGHLVSGHVDGVGRVAAKRALGDALCVELEVPPVLAPFLAPKGSVAIDGVSLTVNGASGTRFDVVLIPVTRRETLLDAKEIGAPVNLEVDVLAKYVARLLSKPGVDGRPAHNPEPGEAGGGGVDIALLRRSGYI